MVANPTMSSLRITLFGLASLSFGLCSAQTISNFSLNPTVVAGGSSSTATVKLSANAPSGGFTVALKSTSSYVGVPGSVTIAAASNQTSFTVTTKPYTGLYLSTLTATAGSSKITTQLAVVNESIAGISLSPSTVSGGSSGTGTVNLVAPAPSGGWTVSLRSYSPSFVSVPATLTIPAGSTSASFDFSTQPYVNSYSALISATDPRSSKSIRVTVIPEGVQLLSLTPPSVTGGGTVLGTVSLGAPAPPGGFRVTLQSQNPSEVTVPSSVTLAEGQSFVNFSITTKAVTANLANTISANDGHTTTNTVLLLRPAGLEAATWPKFNGDTANTGRSTGSGAKGNVKWQFATVGGVGAPPSLGSNGLLYFGDSSGFVYAVHSSNGVESWRFDTNNEIETSPAIGADGTVYVTSFSLKNGLTGQLYALNGSTGALKWEFTNQNVDSSSPAIGSDGTVFVGADGVYALNPSNGAVKWHFKPSTNFVSLSCPAIGPDGTLYITGGDSQTDSGLFALNPQTGAQIWKFTTSSVLIGTSAAVGSNGAVYFADRGGIVYAVAASTGKQVWSYTVPDSISGSVSIGFDGTIYVGSSDDNLYALNGTSGTLKWTFDTGGLATATAALAKDGTIVYGSANGAFEISAALGTEIWESPLSIASSAIIDGNGVIYIGSGGNGLEAIE